MGKGGGKAWGSGHKLGSYNLGEWVWGTGKKAWPNGVKGAPVECQTQTCNGKGGKEGGVAWGLGKWGTCLEELGMKLKVKVGAKGVGSE